MFVCSCQWRAAKGWLSQFATLVSLVYDVTDAGCYSARNGSTHGHVFVSFSHRIVNQTAPAIRWKTAVCRFCFVSVMLVHFSFPLSSDCVMLPVLVTMSHFQGHGLGKNPFLKNNCFQRGSTELLLFLLAVRITSCHWKQYLLPNSLCYASFSKAQTIS